MRELIRTILNEEFDNKIKKIFDDHFGELKIEPGFFYDESFIDKNGFPRLGYKSDAKWSNEKVKLQFNLGFRADDMDKLVEKLKPHVSNIEKNRNIFTKMLGEWFSKKFNKKVIRTYIGDGHRLVSKKQFNNGFVATNMEEPFKFHQSIVDMYLNQKFSNLEHSKKEIYDLWRDDEKNLVMMLSPETENRTRRMRVAQNIWESFSNLFSLDFSQTQRQFKNFIEKKFNLINLEISPLPSISNQSTSFKITF